MRLFTVQADPETGEWIADTLTEIGQIDRAEHGARQDTDAVHYDTFEHEDECAVEVHWWTF